MTSKTQTDFLNDFQKAESDFQNAESDFLNDFQKTQKVMWESEFPNHF